MLLLVPAQVAILQQHNITPATPKLAQSDHHHNIAALLRVYISTRITGPHTDTKLCVTISNRLRPSVSFCGRGHLKLKGLVDLVRAVINERDVIDAFTRVARCPLLVI